MTRPDGAWKRFTSRMAAALGAQLAGEVTTRPPEGWAPFWGAFRDLSQDRSLGFAGPEALGLSEIQAWAALQGTHFAPRPVAVIRALDDAWLDHVRTRRAPEGAKVLPPVSKERLTSTLVNLMT